MATRINIKGRLGHFFRYQNKPTTGAITIRKNALPIKENKPFTSTVFDGIPYAGAGYADCALAPIVNIKDSKLATLKLTNLSNFLKIVFIILMILTRSF